MKDIAGAIWVTILVAVAAKAQVGPDIKALLTSADPTKREVAFHQLAAEDPLQPAARDALVDLLARENAVVKAAFLDGPGASGTYGEGYGEYIGWLTEAVMKIADAEPDRTDAWNSLLAIIPGPGDTAYGRWLGTHGDKALPYLRTYVADHRTDSWDETNRTDALKSMAQIVAYERRPDTIHRLSAKDLQAAEDTVRSGTGDTDALVRRATISAMEIMGNPSDLPTLDGMALTDTEVVTNAGASGAEIRFPLRDYARETAERMRARLAAKTASDKVQ